MNYNRQYIPNSEVDWNFIPVNGMQEYNKDYNELSNGYYSKEIQSFYNDPYQNKSVIDNCVQREPSVFLGSDKRSHIYVSSQEKNDYQELDDFSKVLYETLYGYGELEMSNGSKKDIEAYIFPYNGAFYSQDGLIVEPFFGGPFTLMDIHDDTHDIKKIECVKGQISPSMGVKKKRSYKKKGLISRHSRESSKLKDIPKYNYSGISATTGEQNDNNGKCYNNLYESNMSIGVSDAIEKYKKLKSKSKKKLERKRSETTGM